MSATTSPKNQTLTAGAAAEEPATKRPPAAAESLSPEIEAARNLQKILEPSYHTAPDIWNKLLLSYSLEQCAESMPNLLVMVINGEQFRFSHITKHGGSYITSFFNLMGIYIG